MTRKKLTFNISMYVVLVVLALLFLFPVYLIISMGFFTQADMLEIPRRLIPSHWNWSNFKEVFEVVGRATNEWGEPQGYLFVRYMLNSLFVLVLHVAGCLVTSSLAAYSFAKIKFKGREVMFTIVLATMMIPGSVTIIPLYNIYKTVGIIDTLFPLWLPMWFGGGAINIFLFRQFMRGFPNEVLESASIDGAGHVRKYLQMVMPNIVPSMLYIALTTALGVWNDFQTPLLYIYRQECWTLARGVAAMVTSNAHSPGYVTTQHLMFTACIIMSVFPLALFIAGQKFFIESVTISGLKG